MKTRLRGKKLKGGVISGIERGFAQIKRIRADLEIYLEKEILTAEGAKDAEKI